MSVITKIIMTSAIMCGLFAICVFLSNLSLTILDATGPKLTTISDPVQRKFDNATVFLPGLSSRLYRQETYGKLMHHHGRHLHTPRKFRLQRKNQLNHSLKRVCYYTVPSKEWPLLAPDEIDVTLCTHIIVGFAKISNTSIAPIEDEDELIFKNVIELKDKSPLLKVLLSVGGAGDDKGFRSIIKTEKTSEQFALNSARYLSMMGFDGIDIDWEFPAWFTSFEERFLFQILLREIHQVYKNPIYNLTLSVAVPASKSIIDRSYRVSQMAKYVDFVNMMGYDFHSFHWYLPLTGHNSPLYSHSDEWSMFSTVNLNWTAFYWIQLGMPREKLVIGLPTYGQTYQLYNPAFNGVYVPAIGTGVIGIGGQITYPQTCKFLATGATKKFDLESRVPFAYFKRNWISYDDEDSLEEKAKWIKHNHFGGVMIFDLNCDDYARICSNVSFPLVKSILRGLEL